VADTASVPAAAASELEGRVALVTGAGRGQGRSIALRLASAGARIIAGDILDDDLDAVRDELGAPHLVDRLDVRDAGSWSNVIERGVGMFGRLDVLVNNAGILRRVLIEDETEDGFENIWRVNCLGPFLGIKAVLPHLRASPGATIVNTLSAAAVSAWSMHAAYASSKWALRGLTRAAALELASEGIRVNAVVPGPIATPMLIRDDDPGALDRFANQPLGRIGMPADIAEAVLFLVSDRSSFITGTEITVDGGQLAGTVFKGPPRP
jgi:3alpha(or 20beta)-hydroxysteroid dehydrogenase